MATPPEGADRHSDECRRRLPYTSPLHQSLDRENCARCAWLWGLLDAARDRREAARDACKREIVSLLDKMPHNARGMSWRELREHEPPLAPAGRSVLLPCLRELTEDRILQQHTINGTSRYTIRGK